MRNTLLRQTPAVEDIDVQSQRIDTLDTTEIETKMARPARRFVKRIDTAALAKIVFRRPCAELIKPQRPVVRFDAQPFPRNGLGRHDGAFSDANGTVAAQPLRDGLAFKGKTYCAAMATASMFHSDAFLCS